MKTIVLWSCFLAADAQTASAPRRMRQAPVFGGRHLELGGTRTRTGRMIPILAPAPLIEEGSMSVPSEAVEDADANSDLGFLREIERNSQRTPELTPPGLIVSVELSMAALALEEETTFVAPESGSNDMALLDLSLSMPTSVEEEELTSFEMPMADLSMSMPAFVEEEKELELFEMFMSAETSISMSMAETVLDQAPSGETSEQPTKTPMDDPASTPIVPESIETSFFKVVMLELNSLSLSLSMSMTTTDSPSTPWPSYLPTKAPAARPLTQNELTLPTSYPTKGQETSGTTEPTSGPTRNSKAAKTKAPTTEAPSEAPTTMNPTQGPTSTPTSAPPTASTPPTASAPPTVVTSSPTTTPARAPTTATKIDLATSVRLQLVDMSGTMDDAASSVFEQSCGTFLGSNLAAYSPPISDIKCVVTGQEVDSGRRLESTSAIRGGRRAEEGAPLFVDVDVTGSTTATSSVQDASDVPFEDLVSNSFSVYPDTFVSQVKADANAANIDDFNGLTTVYAIDDLPTDDDDDTVETGDSSAVQTPDGSGNSEGNESNSSVQNGLIAAVAICGVALLGLFAGYFYHVQRRKTTANDGALSEGSLEVIDVYDESLNENLGGIAEQASGEQAKRSFSTEDYADGTNLGVIAQNSGVGRSTDSRNGNDALTYMYSLDDGLASPHSMSQPGPSPTSLASVSLGDQLQNTASSWIDGALPNRIRKDIVAPKGKLGIIIDTCSEGPIVHSVKPTSPLQGLIFKGDLVIAVDDEDTREWSAHYLTKLVAKKSRQERKFTVLRTVVEGEGQREPTADEETAGTEG